LTVGYNVPDANCQDERKFILTDTIFKNHLDGDPFNDETTK